MNWGKKTEGSDGKHFLNVIRTKFQRIKRKRMRLLKMLVMRGGERRVDSSALSSNGGG